MPTPTSVSTATPATEVKSSGADDPAAMKVAPATSSERFNFSEITSKDGTKKSSQIIAKAARKKQISLIAINHNNKLRSEDNDVKRYDKKR